MSSSQVPDWSPFFSLIDVVYCNIAASGILFWDLIITSGDEIDHIWRRRFSGATVLFVLNRYATLIKTIVGYLTLFTTSPTDVYNLFDIIALFVFAAFSAFRIWAIWGRELRPFLIVLPFCLVTPVLNLYRVTQASSTFDTSLPPPFGGCGTDVGLPLGEYIMCVTSQLRASSCLMLSQVDIVRSVAIATDALVLVMTWIKTHTIYKAVRRVKVDTGLSQLLIRDGTLYFGVLLLFNIVDLIINHTSAAFNPVNYFNDVVNSILISRFMLNLRAVNSNPYDRALGSTPSGPGTLHSHIFGDLGGPLTFASTDSSDGASLCSHGTTIEDFERQNGPLSVGLRGWRSAEDLTSGPREADLRLVESLHASEGCSKAPYPRSRPPQTRRTLSENTESLPSTPISDVRTIWSGEAARVKKQKSEEIMVVARERP
ncbi:hypothetical protein PsYK624_011920 [Phanerochaete sordida]|uniref:DUF6533 domain-containing protein n=1 Tax=Phanerochaete sordida TaxID=48140 RepID=A0A9P3FZC9_9APHY|nr:hypothetical protein PsYK624_011920 [Phanerochaete sordida]